MIEKIQTRETIQPKQNLSGRFELTEIATQTGVAVKDNSTGEVLDTLQLLVKIANDVEDIRRAII